LKILNALIIRSRAPFVCLDPFPCLLKRAWTVYFVYQTEPNSSFHPFLKGLQHTFRPYRTFHPSPLRGTGFSCLFSHLRHFRRFPFVRHVLTRSTFLHPFAPSRFRDLFANMGALTPAWPALPDSARVRPPCSRQVSLFHMTRSSVHSVINHLTLPTIAFPLPAQRGRLPKPLSPPMLFPAPAGSSQTSSRLSFRSGLRQSLAGSPQRPAESCSSLSYGLHVHLGLLPTSPRGDAVTFGYQERASPGRGLSPLWSRLLTGALGPITVSA